MMVIPEQYRSINVVKYIVGRGERKKSGKNVINLFSPLCHMERRKEKNLSSLKH
jgi:hypothetical protein